MVEPTEVFGGTFLGMMRRRGEGTVGLGANKHSPLESSESFEGSLPRDAEFELVDVTASQSFVVFHLGHHPTLIHPPRRTAKKRTRGRNSHGTQDRYHGRYGTPCNWRPMLTRPWH